MNENTPQTSQTYFIDAMVTKFSVEGEKICFQIRGTENHLYRKKKEGEEDKFNEYNVFVNMKKEPIETQSEKLGQEIQKTDANLYDVKYSFHLEQNNPNALLISGAFFSRRKIRLETNGTFEIQKVSADGDDF